MFSAAKRLATETEKIVLSLISNESDQYLLKKNYLCLDYQGFALKIALKTA